MRKFRILGPNLRSTAGTRGNGEYMSDLLKWAAAGKRLTDRELGELAASAETAALLDAARERRDIGYGNRNLLSDDVTPPPQIMCEACRYALSNVRPRRKTLPSPQISYPKSIR